MLIHAREPIALEIEVLDLNTGKFIKKCVWANQESGEYEIYKYDDTNGITYEIIKNANIVFVYKGE